MPMFEGDLIEDEWEDRLSEMMINSEMKDALNQIRITNGCLMWNHFAHTIELTGCSGSEAS